MTRRSYARTNQFSLLSSALRETKRVHQTVHQSQNDQLKYRSQSCVLQRIQHILDYGVMDWQLIISCFSVPLSYSGDVSMWDLALIVCVIGCFSGPEWLTKLLSCLQHHEPFCSSLTNSLLTSICWKGKLDPGTMLWGFRVPFSAQRWCIFPLARFFPRCNTCYSSVNVWSGSTRPHEPQERLSGNQGGGIPSLRNADAIYQMFGHRWIERSCFVGLGATSKSQSALRQETIYANHRLSWMISWFMNQEHKIWSRVQNPPSKTRVHLLLCNSTVRFARGYTHISLSGFWLDNNLPENHAALTGGAEFTVKFLL